jgi:hypothetical protein
MEKNHVSHVIIATCIAPNGGIPIPIGGNSTRIYWPVSGNYYPIVAIGFANGTYRQQTYPDYRVSVASSDIALQERFGRINEVISIALVAFGFVEGLRIIQEHGKNVVGSQDSGPISTPTSASPEPKATPKTKKADEGPNPATETRLN